jgi:hypothetical protein
MRRRLRPRRPHAASVFPSPLAATVDGARKVGEDIVRGAIARARIESNVRASTVSDNIGRTWRD